MTRLMIGRELRYETHWQMYSDTQRPCVLAASFNVICESARLLFQPDARIDINLKHEICRYYAMSTVVPGAAVGGQMTFLGVACDGWLCSPQSSKPSRGHRLFLSHDGAIGWRRKRDREMAAWPPREIHVQPDQWSFLFRPK